MLKSDLINKLHELHPKLSKLQSKIIVDALFTTMSHALSQGHRIEYRGFGAFSLKVRKISFIMNPYHGVLIESKDRNVVYFRASKELAARVNHK